MLGTVRTALEKKLPKLAGTDAQRRLLMFERDQWHLSHETVAEQIEDLRDDFPLLASIDEVWIAETHDDRKIVLFELLIKGRRYSPVFIFSGDKLLHAAPGY